MTWMAILSKWERPCKMANIITGIRIVCSIALLFCPLFSQAFYALYKSFRNNYAHPGTIFPWTKLEEMLTLLFADSKTTKKGLFGKEHVIHGLMFENEFSKVYKSGEIQNSQPKTPTTDHNQGKTVKTYCRVDSRIKKCTVDHTVLVQTPFPIMRKDGRQIKLNMQHCKSCGRRYLFINGLSESQNITDYDLEEVAVSEWKE